MTDDCTPTTEVVRGRHNANATLDSRTWRMADAEFDRWLAARDAKLRAEWEAEQRETKVFSAQVAPLGFDVTPGMVQEVWDTFVKPGQSEDAPPQSAEMRVLMAILRGVYAALAPVPDTTNTESNGKA